MDAVLLDTDVFSFLIRHNDSRAELYRPLVRGKTISLSFVSVGELYAWSEKRQWSGRTLAKFEERLRAAVIIPYDLELCKTYGRVKSNLPKGLTIPGNDLWIAVCAIRHSISLITHNRKHFEKVPNLNLISQTPTSPGKTAALFGGES